MSEANALMIVRRRLDELGWPQKITSFVNGDSTKDVYPGVNRCPPIRDGFPKGYWIATLGFDDLTEQESFIFAVHKDTGEIHYAGGAGDVW